MTTTLEIAQDHEFNTMDVLIHFIRLNGIMVDHSFIPVNPYSDTKTHVQETYTIEGDEYIIHTFTSWYSLLQSWHIVVFNCDGEDVTIEESAI